MSPWTKLFACAALLAGVLDSVWSDAEAVERQRANLILRQPFNLALDQARRFNGSTDYGAASLSLSGYNKLTVSCWFWWNAFANDFGMLYEYTNSVAPGGFRCCPNYNTGIMEFGANGGGSLTQRTITRPSAAAWHHLVVEYDLTAGGANTVPVAYIDNVSQSLTTLAAGGGTTTFANNTITYMARTGPTLNAAGRLQGFTIFPGLLTASQVSSLYNNGAGADPRTCTGVQPLYYWPNLNGVTGVGIRGNLLPGGIGGK